MNASTSILCALPFVFSCAALNRSNPSRPGVQVGEVPTADTAFRSRIRIATYNVHGEPADVIARAFRTNPSLRDADVILFQEIEHHTDEGKSRAALVAEELGMGHAYAPGYGLANGGSHGVAILTRLPMTDVEVIELPYYDLHYNSARRVALAVTVSAGDERVRIICVHLDNRVNPERRIEQMTPVIDRAAREPIDRVVIAGDLNTSPFCWLTHVIPIPCGEQASRLEDYVRTRGFDTPAIASGATSKWMHMRLDAVYTRGLLAENVGVEHTVRISDHLPLWIDLELEHAAVVSREASPR